MLTKLHSREVRIRTTMLMRFPMPFLVVEKIRVFKRGFFDVKFDVKTTAENEKAIRHFSHWLSSFCINQIYFKIFVFRTRRWLSKQTVAVGQKILGIEGRNTFSIKIHFQSKYIFNQNTFFVILKQHKLNTFYAQNMFWNTGRCWIGMMCSV